MLSINCSKLSRSMSCAGHLFLDQEVKLSSQSAEEGEAASELLAASLSNRQVTDVSKNGIYYDEDMKFFVAEIVDDIKKRGTTFLCEEKIDWQTRSGIWIKGRYDCAFIDNRGFLCIEDLKYGFGLVEVEQNWQLISYAIGEIIRRAQSFEKIALMIHQPRAHHENGTSREWLISYSQLLEYKEMIEKRMQEIVDGRKDFFTGQHCKYCPGAAEQCTAFNRLFHNSLEVCTTFFKDSISNQELSRQLDAIKRAEEVLKVKQDSLVELGSSRIKRGEIIPNYVQTNQYSNRQWKPGISPDSIKIMTGKNVIEQRFMTPAKAEKNGVSKKLIENLTQRVFTGVKLEKKNITEVGNKIFGTEQPNGGN